MHPTHSPLSFGLLAVLLIAVCACAGQQAEEATPGGEITSESSVVAVRGTLEPCSLTPIAIPTPPAVVPGYAQLDETTGLHMTGTIPEDEVDLESWRLEVSGNVATPLSLSYDELRCMSQVKAKATLVCPGFFVDEGEWAGVPLLDVLKRAGAPTTGNLRLYGADGYTRDIAMETAVAPTAFLAYEWEGEPLPILHGFPLRAVFVGSDGNLWVKWLYRIEVL